MPASTGVAIFHPFPHGRHPCRLCSLQLELAFSASEPPSPEVHHDSREDGSETIERWSTFVPGSHSQTYLDEESIEAEGTGIGGE